MRSQKIYELHSYLNKIRIDLQNEYRELLLKVNGAQTLANEIFADDMKLMDSLIEQVLQFQKAQYGVVSYKLQALDAFSLQEVADFIEKKLESKNGGAR